ncbi:MAG: 2OG-Fe(II) oxygenase, partial [Pseudomonadales bacterium]
QRKPNFMTSVLPFARPPVDNEALFALIAQALREKGYVVLPAALPAAVADSLLEYMAHLGNEQFHHGSIGRGETRMHNQFVRRDKITWIEPDAGHAKEWHIWTQELQQYLNRQLLLGLFSFESHFACYEPGGFYQKHVDAFYGQSNRVLSLVTYLNRDWAPDQGGELVIYNEQGEELVKVTPGFGTLVLFLSEEFPHEVLKAERSRFSVAGWFRVNTSTSDRVDPPN